MNRRDFLKRAGLLSAGAIAAPYILPSGSLFASTGTQRVGHVVFCLFAGGIRNLESVHKVEGNLMPYTLNGNESISPDIAAMLTGLPATLLPQALQNYGTLFKEFRYLSGPTGHFNGHTTAVTGQYTDNNLSLRNHPKNPTVFELFRKFSDPQRSAMDAWWITNNNDVYPVLNFSDSAGFGAAFGANHFAPLNLVNYDVGTTLSNMLSFSTTQEEKNEHLRTFMNRKFAAGGANGLDSVNNPASDRARIQSFITRMFTERLSGQHNNPWGTGVMSWDMRNIFYAEEIIKEFKPALTVVNITGVDVCHTDFTGYCDNLRMADYAAAHLWQTIESTPGMAGDTVMIMMPEVGRNSQPNSILDVNGRGALDHTSSDAMAREIFCLIAGPPSVIRQGQVISSTEGESIDIVPTIANLLGFDQGASSFLPGRPLTQAFV
jgi:hypothetical protein